MHRIITLTDRVLGRLVGATGVASAACTPRSFREYKMSGGVRYVRTCTVNSACTKSCGSWTPV